MKYLNLSAESKRFFEKLIKIWLLGLFQMRYSEAIAKAAARKVTTSLLS